MKKTQLKINETIETLTQCICELENICEDLANEQEDFCRVFADRIKNETDEIKAVKKSFVEIGEQQTTLITRFNTENNYGL